MYIKETQAVAVMKLNMAIHFKKVFSHFSHLTHFFTREFRGIKRTNIGLTSIDEIISGTAVKGFFRLRCKCKVSVA